MSSPSGHDPAAVLLARSAAVLYLLALLTGGLAALALSGDLGGADGKIALGAHVSAITGGLIMLAVAYTIPMTSFGAVGRTRLAWGFIVANYANWAVSTGKAFFHVHGVGKTGDVANDVVFVLLNVFVVLPSIASTLAWIHGLRVARTTT